MVWDELTNQRQNQLVSLIPTMKYQRIIKIGLHVCVWGLLLLTPILFPPAFEGNPNLDAFISVRAGGASLYLGQLLPSSILIDTY
jgi:hypothetical protein